MSTFTQKSKSVLDLLKISRELSDVAAAMGILSWDQETYMPKGGAASRAYQLSTLSGIYHQLLTRQLVGKTIAKAENDAAGGTDFDKGLIREMRREYEKATKLPRALVERISESTSRAFDSWQKAKSKSDFSIFEKDLERVLELQVQAANLAKNPGQTTYDLMLDNHDEGLQTTTVDRVFSTLRNPLSKMSSLLCESTKIPLSVFAGRKFLEKEQWKLGEDILTKMGFDFDSGRQDKSAHPFTINLGVNDVRITTWVDEKDPRPMIFATIHEGGHALYEQGVDPLLERTHLAGGQGLILHESQSRLWENIIGRSKEFWNHQFQPYLDSQMWIKAINTVKPSLVRVEADEVTYGLHIMVRYEIEQALVDGKIKVFDLPKVWNDKYFELLGVRPENDSEGVLQDVHWSHGSFGYFPTYLLGTVAATQIWASIPNEMKDLSQISLGKIRSWLKDNIHCHGKTYTSDNLIRRVTGEGLNPSYFLKYLEKKFELG